MNWIKKILIGGEEITPGDPVDIDIFNFAAFHYVNYNYAEETLKRIAINYKVKKEAAAALLSAAVINHRGNLEGFSEVLKVWNNIENPGDLKKDLELIGVIFDRGYTQEHIKTFIGREAVESMRETLERIKGK